ncbi:MAG: glucose 1-dehydrogenase [Candidatus Marinimicrobia bacterium]|nr:glucose 1-dehydrogenase [Candidatus Neomarinimicrobiota bacterium]
MDRLLDKVAIITGGGKGIGKATVKKFLEEGAKVLIADFDAQSGNQTAEDLSSLGEVKFLKVDVSQEDQIQDMVKSVVDMYGRIDICVNNAGILMDQTLKKLDSDLFDKVMNVNLRGVFLCTKYVADVMRDQQSGVILNASSVVAHYGNYGQTNYVAAKSGVIGMTKVWARELGKDGIRVNSVAPGFIKTDMTATIPEKIIEMMSAKVPLKRWGEAVDVANVYAFLASDEAAYINGAVINVDGGVVV